MCIINFEAEVKKTKIFVAPSHDGSRQFVAYSNEVETSISNNAMILPVPYPDTVKLHDLSHYTSLFNDLSYCFPKSLGATNYSTDSMTFSKNSKLAVYDVGSYQVSICNCIDDFDRIDQLIFMLDPFVKTLLSAYYTNRRIPFGFIVCKLRKGSATYHPLGYSYRIYSSRGYMFVPTRHHHSGSNEELISDWDHEIYSINTSDHAGELGNHQGFKLKHISGFDFPDIKTIHKATLAGKLRNSDFFAQLSDIKITHQFMGVDGCIFSSNNIDKLRFLPNRLTTTPAVNIDGKFYYFGWDQSGPVSFYGNKIEIEIHDHHVKIIDEIGSLQEKQYLFKLKHHTMLPDGKLLLLALADING